MSIRELGLGVLVLGLPLRDPVGGGSELGS